MNEYISLGAASAPRVTAALTRHLNRHVSRHVNRQIGRSPASK